ncbi:PAS domain S-box protein [Ktedonobacter racemifer]|uniref:histidine kinase n=1 Tax=Ktedonobacter racemifer DSM 44963 TaxID=485913 RepID=D6TUY2_KTERA|nr:PAS domain S-box protein [Ktedonobacter racemifer]EFH85308.1 PAS/PAC sensor signal transduction histidine kinase [Ktedonobacter racemifer DSM 44963]
MSNAKQTRRVTPASSDTLLTILETLPDAFFVVDDATTIVYTNASAQAMLGATREELCGTSLWRGAPHLVSPSLYQAVRKTRQTREPTNVAYVSPTTHSWLHVQLSPTVGGLMLHFHEGRAPTRRQESFSQSEHLCADILENISDWLAILAPDGMILAINQRPLEDAQVRREEIVGRSLAETPWWSYAPAVLQRLRAAIEQACKGETVRFDSRICPQPGWYLDLAVTIAPHFDANKQVEYLLYVGLDITKRKQVEDELRTLVDALPQFVWIARPDGYVTYLNQRLLDSLALTHEQAEGDGWLAGVHPDDRQRVWEAWQTSIQAGEPYEVGHRMQDGTSGAYRWFLARGMPQRNAQGTILRWVGTCTDIEEQKRVEQQLKASEENWRVLAETVPQFVWTIQPDGSAMYFNQRYYDYTGASPEQALGHGWSQFLHPDDSEQARALRRHLLATGEAYEIEYRLREGKTGNYRWFLARAMPVRDETGQIVKWFGTSTDIEEQKRAEQWIKESEENLRVLAETVPQLVWTARPDGRHEYTNQHWCDYTGLTLEHFQSDGWAHLQFIHPDDRESNRVLGQHALDTGELFEHEERLREGQTGAYRWFLTRALPVRDEAGQIVKWFGTSTDIDEQKRIEEALRESQERASTLMNSNIIGTFVGEGEQIVDANDTFLRMTGYTREDLRAGRINWMHMTPPEYLTRTLEAHKELAAQPSLAPYEKEYVCKDGSRLPVLVGGVVLEHHPRQAIIFVLDNSARKELEQRKDDFINMASHELRTPLTVVKLQTHLVHKRLEKHSQHEAATALSRVERPIEQLERLIAELLDVSQMQTGRLKYIWERVDLDELLREIADTMQRMSPSHTIVVRGTVQTSVTGDRDRLRQVFTNLLSNAIKYSPNAKTVEVELSASEEAVTIRVQDHGLGIPREKHKKIFERFYRATGLSHETIPGLGMGLYIVAEIVKGHGGTITVESDVGKGSTFTVTLPRKRDA